MKSLSGRQVTPFAVTRIQILLPCKQCILEEVSVSLGTLIHHCLGYSLIARWSDKSLKLGEIFFWFITLGKLKQEVPKFAATVAFMVRLFL